VEAVQDPIVSQAIEWMVLLRSGTATSRDAQAFAGWRGLDPRHDEACRRIEGVLGGLSVCQAAPDATRQALLAKRRTLKLLAGCGVVVAAGLLTRHSSMANALFDDYLAGSFADYRAGTGKREVVTLADGSTMTLNAHSRADRYADGVTLRMGEVFVQHQASHVIAVQTREGRVSATRAEFAVRQFNEFSRVAVLAGEVQINPASGAQVLLRQGEVACLRAAACERQAHLSAQAETAWLGGLLQVSDRSLREVAAALADYRSGFIHVADAVAGLRVSGTFPLDDTNRALSALGKVLPVRIVFNTDYLVRIEAA